jgi:hypothetical protein
MGVGDAAVQLLVVAEPRLMLAMQLHSAAAVHSIGPAADPASGSSGGNEYAAAAAQQGDAPLLTLASVLEAERAAALLVLLVPHSGLWQLRRPGSLAAFRAAAARFVEFVAAPSLHRHVCCHCLARLLHVLLCLLLLELLQLLLGRLVLHHMMPAVPHKAAAVHTVHSLLCPNQRPLLRPLHPHTGRCASLVHH